jgi:hypothetical protein
MDGVCVVWQLASAICYQSRASVASYQSLHGEESPFEPPVFTPIMTHSYQTTEGVMVMVNVIDPLLSIPPERFNFRILKRVTSVGTAGP